MSERLQPAAIKEPEKGREGGFLSVGGFLCVDDQGGDCRAAAGTELLSAALEKSTRRRGTLLREPVTDIQARQHRYEQGGVTPCPARRRPPFGLGSTPSIINPLPHQTFGWREADFVILDLGSCCAAPNSLACLISGRLGSPRTNLSPSLASSNSSTRDQAGVPHDVRQDVCTMNAVFITQDEATVTVARSRALSGTEEERLT